MSTFNFVSANTRQLIEKLILRAKSFIIVLIREMDEGGLKNRAMSLVYTTLLSLAPLLAVSFSVLKGFGIHNQIEPLLRRMLAPLGDKAEEITTNVIQFVEHIQVGVLGFVGFAMLFYTVVSLLSQVEESFNYIWRVSKGRPLYRRFTDYLSVVLVGPVLLFAAVGIAASMGNAAVVKWLTGFEPFGVLYYALGIILPYVLGICAFTFAYAFIPYTSVPWRAALTGGVCAGLIWKVTGSLFTTFIVDSAQYSAIYSGFAAILIAMIWLYINWLILLCGGVIAFYVQFPRYLSYAARRPRLSIQRQEQLSLLLMTLIGRQHLQGGAACTLKTLADTVELPWELVTEQLECLKQHGFIMMADASYVLAKDSDSILLRDIVQAIRTEGDQPAFAILEKREEGIMHQLLADLAENPAKLLQNRSLREVIQAEASTPEQTPR
ncbi:MAG: YhjD/YihY/BrkB family envelope integrity protein [Methylomonas sp.]